MLGKISIELNTLEHLEKVRTNVLDLNPDNCGSRISHWVVPTCWGGGGVDLRLGRFSAEMCMKTKELGPVGGPAAPPGSNTARKAGPSQTCTAN